MKNLKKLISIKLGYDFTENYNRYVLVQHSINIITFNSLKFRERSDKFFERIFDELDCLYHLAYSVRDYYENQHD